MQDLDWASVDVLDLIVYSFLYAQLNMFIEVMTKKKFDVKMFHLSDAHVDCLYFFCSEEGHVSRLKQIVIIASIIGI